MFSATSLEVPVEKRIQWLTDALYRVVVPIGDEYVLDKWEEAWIPTLSRYVMRSVNRYDGMVKSLLWTKYTREGELYHESRM